MLESVKNKVFDNMKVCGSGYTFGHGNTANLIDKDGNIVQSYTYDAFGALTAGGQDKFNGYQYVGNADVFTDTDAGLQYMQNRWYDPQLGRFISRDPIGFEGGLNLYQYANNNPLRFTDPSGLDWFRAPSYRGAYAVGRDARNGEPSVVPTGGAISRFIENYFPAGRTFGLNHDTLVDSLTGAGVPDWLANIPTMGAAYEYSVIEEALKSLQDAIDKIGNDKEKSGCE